jgi:tryptophan halogenase
MRMVLAEEVAKYIHCFADQLPGPYGFESSVKCVDNQLFSHRFLVTFPKVAIDMGVDLDSFLSALNFPLTGKIKLQALLIKGDIIHLGFEQALNEFVCKIYIEESQRVRQMLQHTGLVDLEKIPVHRALKWYQNGICIESNYDWLPCSTKKILCQQIQILCPSINGNVIEKLISLVCKKASLQSVQLLQVTEKGNPRKSFDLNLYDAHINVGDIEPLLSNLFTGDALTGLHRFINSDIRDQQLGHLGAGLSREGRPFVTLYYGGSERGDFLEKSKVLIKSDPKR